MSQAIALALKARDPRPNPYVGALLVKNGRVISRGFHRGPGRPHAEVVCLKAAGRRARGAVLYVTLEPCRHFGRTPPCAPEIIKAGVRRVVVAGADPNPLNCGQGIRQLRRAGIEVTTNVLSVEAKETNRAFFKYITRGMPYVCLKLAQSLDGKIATRSFRSRWITGGQSRKFAHRLRRDFDAIMVGSNTLLQDDPGLCGASKNIKIVVDTNLKVSLGAKIFEQGEVIIATCAKRGIRRKRQWGKMARIVVIERDDDRRVDLKALMFELAGQGISKILVEGGGVLAGSLLDARLVDEAMFFIAPKIIGGRDAPGSVMGQGALYPDKAIELGQVSWQKAGDDFLLRGYIINP